MSRLGASALIGAVALSTHTETNRRLALESSSVTASRSLAAANQTVDRLRQEVALLKNDVQDKSQLVSERMVDKSRQLNRHIEHSTNCRSRMHAGGEPSGRQDEAYSEDRARHCGECCFDGSSSTISGSICAMSALLIMNLMALI